MKFSLFICAIFAITFRFSEVSSQKLSCEKIENWDWLYIRSLKTCRMQKTTTVNSDEFVVSPPDSTIEAIILTGNKKIKFLPIRIDETFPSLAVYDAQVCSIKVISKKHFKNLKKLTHLHLDRNEIERISSEVFEDLTSLEVLHLASNEIKQINGAVFSGLIKLRSVTLNFNVCIDKFYFTPAYTPTGIASLSQEVTEKCGFSEVEENPKKVLQSQHELTTEKKVMEDTKI